MDRSNRDLLKREKRQQPSHWEKILTSGKRGHAHKHTHTQGTTSLPFWKTSSSCTKAPPNALSAFNGKKAKGREEKEREPALLSCQQHVPNPRFF
mmetsp:Transcript_37947/g.74607  ORF Transcript_37947/g.74607 Transcript_37947/m.74607 type:complete len:95 (-) Transcript_37947:634-918(-)